MQLISSASLVITDSFHATVFSILFSTPFYALLRNEASDPKNMNGRLFNLLNIAGLSERIIPDFNPTFCPSADLNFENAHKALAALRSSSLDYLKKALDI
jgi:hypothetical protein